VPLWKDLDQQVKTPKNVVTNQIKIYRCTTDIDIDGKPANINFNPVVE
jgi:hypothetical protein